VSVIGKIVSHYKILEKLGEGGMGIVYKAEDTKLKRVVALKFLPTQLTRDSAAKERFIQEARAASGLDHPNICTIFEIDETGDGRSFIAMALYGGGTLRERIARGPVEVEEAIGIALQIAQGLGRAHEAGIVHRDVKPANIMITDRGEVKIVDFGLAKLAGGAKLTRTGSTLGTAAYMSPEQARGEAIDRRTDIWSLGVVLYEMLTGALPFKGDHEAALLYSIVHEEPQALSALRPALPAPVSHLVAKALQKDPALRYQSAGELAADLRRLAVAGAAPPRMEKSIAVLPFENLSPDPDQEYFSDGLTEEVISDLSNVRALRVISRSSAMTFKGTKKKVPEIARELDVRYVLEGSVRKAGNSLRITAQLIDAANDAHLWAEKFSGTLDDVFDVQEKVSRSIVSALKLKLTPEESRKIAARPIENVAAYQCYLRAYTEIWRFSESALETARTQLQRGLDILGDNALLLATMGTLYFQYANIGAAQEDYIAKAEEYVRRALALDPDIPQAHAILGLIVGSFYGDVHEALRELKAALASNPNDVDALRFMTMLSVILGKQAAAAAFMERHKAIDPLSEWNWLFAGGFYLYGGPYERAVEPLRRYYELDPTSMMAQYLYASSLIYVGRLEEAFSIIDRAAEVAPDNVAVKFGLLMKHALLKEREKALGEMTPDFQKTCRRDLEWSYHVAVPLALLDAKEESFDWLENAVNKGFINYPELSRNPHLDNLRADPRFEKLLERVKDEWEHFEV
jgi:serine/threonine protein kinase/Flp pilus assembly protein TadD